MSDDPACPAKDPPVHVISGDEKLQICLSNLAKWVAGLVVTLIDALLIGAFAFAWASNDKLGDINRDLSALNQRIDDMNRRVDRVDARVDRKADR